MLHEGGGGQEGSWDGWPQDCRDDDGPQGMFPGSKGKVEAHDCLEGVGGGGGGLPTDSLKEKKGRRFFTKKIRFYR